MTTDESTDRGVHVRHLGGDRFEIGVRGHVLTVDQPAADGGEDSAPTPTELFIAGLAGCVAFYGRRYCARHGVDPEGLAVDVRYRMGERPARVADIEITITPPIHLPPERREPFLAVASHCTVHNTLTDPPVIRVGLALAEHPVAS
ncbi:MAG TPA: OsmC family protein [Mycobacteriales bacterium]|nr:OsmC family protein [Mycobacteriales bacterium]